MSHDDIMKDLTFESSMNHRICPIQTKETRSTSEADESNLSTPTDPGIWQSQTPHNPTEAFPQSILVKSRIACYRSSSPTPIFETVAALAKGTELLADANTPLTTDIRSLRKANEALNKRRRA
ncbi:hypothetical protein EAF00_010886 [Botryotinia globosa]|nr:hypothetical protein EAF00_010886 [Botryotinia globosa]